MRRRPWMLLVLLLAATSFAAGAGAIFAWPADAALGPERVVSAGPAGAPVSDGRYLVFEEGLGERNCPPPNAVGAVCGHDYAHTTILDVATGGRRVIAPPFSARESSLSEGRARVPGGALLDLATGDRTALDLPEGFGAGHLHEGYLYGWTNGSEAARVRLDTGALEPLGLRAPERAARHYAGVTDSHVAIQWYHPDDGFVAHHEILQLADDTRLQVPLAPGERLVSNGDVPTLALAPGRALALIEQGTGAVSLRIHALPDLEPLADFPLGDGVRPYALTLGEDLWVLQVVHRQERMTFLWGDLDGRAVHAPADQAERDNAVAAGAVIAYRMDGALVVAAPGAPPLTALALGATSVAAAFVAVVVFVAARHVAKGASAASAQGARCAECGAPRPQDPAFCVRCGRAD